MARTTPTVWVSWGGPESRVEVQFAGTTKPPIALDTPAWQAWLELSTTTCFAYPIYDQRVGYIRAFMTVRKEQRQRGGQYWVAYHRNGGRLRKIYLGRAAQLSQQRLGCVAERFLALATALPAASHPADASSTGRR